MILRPGLQSLLQDAQRRRFDVVLGEALDQISRDHADVATLFKHLRFAADCLAGRGRDQRASGRLLFVMQGSICCHVVSAVQSLPES
jgi:Resolvase, N terminal domain